MYVSRLLLSMVVLVLLGDRLPAQHRAQDIPGAAIVRTDPQTGQVDYIRFRENEGPTWTALLSEPQPWMPRNLSTENLRLLSTRRDRLGMTHHRLQQQLAGHPIEGAVLRAMTINGQVTALIGDVRALRPPVTKATLTEQQALGRALAHVQAHSYRWEVDPGWAAPQGELVFTPRDGNFDAGEYVLTWKFDIYAVHPWSRAWIYVDATTGGIVWDRNRIHSVDVPATAVTGHSGIRPIVTDSLAPNQFALREAGRGGGIVTRNMNQQLLVQNSTLFLDADNYWNNVNANQDEFATDAHLGAEFTYDYFMQTHGWNSYDGQGAPIISFVHQGVNMPGAFWDGDGAHYGDGDGQIFTLPLTSPDVCAHEIMHGVSEHAAGLTFRGESGALHESFSDVFGTVVEAQVRPSTWDWILGAEITPNNAGIRDMADPTQFNHPDTYGGPLWVNNGSSHSNAGVQNKWFYILTTGEADTNALGNAYNVPAIGMAKAAAITFRSLSVYLNPTANYSDARFFSIEAAKDLYGNCSPEMVATTNAWYAVGVGTAYTDTPAVSFSAYPTTACAAPATIQFTNLSGPASGWRWEFGDGTSSTQANPIHTYTNWGSYDVKLVATGCTNLEDSLIQTAMVTIDSNLACPLSMPSDASGTLFACSGTLLDPGGNGPYPNANNSVIAISPPNAAQVVLNFSMFDLDPGSDWLRIYNGQVSMSNLIGEYTGQNLPNGGTIVSTGSTISMWMSADLFGNGQGFELTWTCVPTTSPPVSDFRHGTSYSCDGMVTFTDESLGFPTSWQWDFGDGGTSTNASPTHTYASSGTYAVQLIACNTNGCDTLLKPNLVIVDLQSTSCDTFVVPDTGAVALTNCQGVLMDNGKYGPYTNNLNSTATIAPPGATGIELSFSQFATEWNRDILYIYDGPSTSSPILGFFSGTNLPLGGTIRSSGGAVTLRFESNIHAIDQGFLLDWKAYGTTGGPDAAFNMPATAPLNSTVNFTDQSANAATWTWDFGDGGTAAIANPSHTYTALGTYRVLLEVIDSEGCADSISQVITIGPPVGISNAAAPTLQLWPNPASDQLRIEFVVEGQTDLEFSVADVHGQVIVQREMKNTEALNTILDVSGWAAGIYFLKVQTPAHSLIRRFAVY